MCSSFTYVNTVFIIKSDIVIKLCKWNNNIKSDIIIVRELRTVQLEFDYGKKTKISLNSHTKVTVYSLW